jgi:hypothetical protein
MEAKVERELRELLEIAGRVMEEGRAPTAEERARFLAIRPHLEKGSPGWRARLSDEIDRLAAALEGMGI